MCLIMDTQLTEEVRARRTLTGWKLVMRETDCLTSYWAEGYRYRPGLNEAGGEPEFYSSSLTRLMLYGGVIHVFLREEDARRLQTRSGCPVIPVRCEPEDLVAAGMWDDGTTPTAAYRKVWIEESDYQEAMTCPATSGVG